MIGYPLGVDIDPIGAAHVEDEVAALHLLKTSMVAGDLRVVQDNGIIWKTSKANLRSAQRYGTNGRQDLLLRRRAIVVGQGNQRAMLIADTENIASLQGFAKRHISGNQPTLVEEAVGGPELLGVGMYEYELIAFVHNLCVISRDNALVDDNVV